MKNILLKIKEHWNYKAEPEDVKIFSKEWFVCIPFILGVLGFITLLVLLCRILDADIEAVLGFLFFGGFCFVIGIVFRSRRRHRLQKYQKRKIGSGQMKKILLISIVFIAGCPGSPIQTQSEAKQNRKAMIGLSPGVTKNEVLEIMGGPRRTEFYVSEGNNTEIWFYLTEGTTSLNKRIIETNFTPLVFEEDKLIGWGSRYVDEHIKKYELRIR